jgi:hypothetical protein
MRNEGNFTFFPTFFCKQQLYYVWLYRKLDFYYNVSKTKWPKIIVSILECGKYTNLQIRKKTKQKERKKERKKEQKKERKKERTKERKKERKKEGN